MYRLVYTKQAVKDLAKLKESHLDKKVKQLIEIMRGNLFQTPPPYEKLTGRLSGYYSRRINIQHRLVYQVSNEAYSHLGIEYAGYIKIIRMWTHYE